MLSLLVPLLTLQGPAPAATAADAVDLLRASRTEPIAVSALERALAQDPSAAVTILRSGELPARHEDERRQTLSKPQRELLLQALASQPARTLRALDRKLAAGQGGLAARLWLAQAHAGARELTELLTAAAPAEADAALAAGLEDPLVALVAKLLGEDASAAGLLASQAAGLHPALVRPLLEGVGQAGSGAGLQVVAEVLSWHPEAYAYGLAQVRHVARGCDRDIARRVGNLLRSSAKQRSLNTRQEVARALGALGDEDGVPTLIAWLEHEDKGLRDAALWGLERISGLRLGRRPGPWTRWFAEELGALSEVNSLRAKLQHGDPAAQVAALRRIVQRSLWRDRWAELVAECRPRGTTQTVLCCQTLAALGQPESSGRLVEWLQEGHPDVREAAHAALRSLTGLDLPPDASSWAQALEP